MHQCPFCDISTFLLTVPGGSDGPSGVLICSENYITYKNLGDQPDIRCPIPRRRVSLIGRYIPKSLEDVLIKY